jgi:hypothetical protein
MTHEEIIRWFRRFKYDPEFRDEHGSLTVRMVPLCEFAGVARQNVYLILRKEMALTENYRNRLTYAIECVQAGLRWRRTKKVYHMEGGDFARFPRFETRRKDQHAGVA